MADHSVGFKSTRVGAGRGLPEKASPLATPEPGLKEPVSPHAQVAGRPFASRVVTL